MIGLLRAPVGYILTCPILGIAAHTAIDAADTSDVVDFGSVGPKDAGIMTEEKLEQLLKPGAKSIDLTLRMAVGKKSNGLKQKTRVIQSLQEYVHCLWVTVILFLLLVSFFISLNLFIYCSDVTTGRGLHIQVPEEKFQNWLIDYRTGVTAAKEEDEGWVY